MPVNPLARFILRAGEQENAKHMDEREDIAGSDDPASEIEQLHLANRDLQDQVAALRQEADAAQAAARLMRESRWWRLGLALRNRRNVLFALRHPIWALKTVAGLRTRRGRLGRGGRSTSATTARQWLAGISAAPRVPEDLWIAGIFDAELGRALEPDCNLIAFRPDNWQVTLEGRRPHLLLVESAEHGNDGSWEYKIGTAPHADAAGLQDLRELVEWCRANGTPTVFWFTTQMSQAERFAEAAALFDHVVASEPNGALRLQRAGDLRASDVLVVPVGVQPALHSPIGAVPASDTCTVLSPATSTAALEPLLVAAQASGVTVYAPAGQPIASGVAHSTTQVGPRALEQAVARHAVYINPEDMGLPPRVLQALASGTTVVSVPNPMVEDAFGGVVTVARTTEEAKEAIERLLSDDAHRASVRAAGLRVVLGEHTIRHRIGAIARTAGYELDEGSDARVAALVLVDSASEIDEVVRTLAAQRHAPAEILFGIAGDVPAETEPATEGPALRVIQHERRADPAERLRGLAALAISPWVAPLDRGSSLDANGLNDLLLAQRFARADVLGSGDGFVFTDRIGPGVAVARREVVASRGWPPAPSWVREGIRIFTVPR
jgi:glycosyl transferase family 1